jgi:hypothetical protein
MRCDPQEMRGRPLKAISTEDLEYRKRRRLTLVPSHEPFRPQCLPQTIKRIRIQSSAYAAVRSCDCWFWMGISADVLVRVKRERTVVDAGEGLRGVSKYRNASGHMGLTVSAGLRKYRLAFRNLDISEPTYCMTRHYETSIPSKSASTFDATAGTYNTDPTERTTGKVRPVAILDHVSIRGQEPLGIIIRRQLDRRALFHRSAPDSLLMPLTSEKRHTIAVLSIALPTPRTSPNLPSCCTTLRSAWKDDR